MSYEKILKECVTKIENDAKSIGNDLDENCLPLKHIFCWTQGFVTGMMGIAFQYNKNLDLLKKLYGLYDSFYEKVTKYSDDTMHDNGFLYSPYAVMMHKITDDPNMAELTVHAADCLAKRYVAEGGYIRAWGRMDGVIPDYVDEELAKDHFFQKSQGVAIVDCMMNLPLLFRASEITGRPFYKSIAISHLETTIKYFIREDNTVYHAYRFASNGSPMCPDNFCGYSVDSVWARGTTWIIYGLAIAYRYTQNQKYLDTAVVLFKKFIELCGDELIPMWDFRLPKATPAKSAYRNNNCPWDETDAVNRELAKDASAAAIAVCAAQEILTHLDDESIKEYKDSALKCLCSKYYKISEEGFLSHTDGRSIYQRYGDYYFMQALATEVMEIENCW